MEEAFEVGELGFVYDPWRSRPGMAVYRKHADISGYEVTIADLIIRYLSDNGDLIGIDRRGFEPVDSFEMNTDREVAAKMAAEYFKESTLQPDHVELVQIQDGASRLKDLNVYWEFHFDKGYVYVRCNDGNVLVNPGIITEPINF